MEIFEGDLCVAANASGGGLGDPIERDPALITADLDNGMTTEWQANSIYCVKPVYDEEKKHWKVDESATDELRDAKRKERQSKAMPAREWWEKSRQRVKDRNMDSKILEMYQSSMRLSESFTQEFKDFWALSDDFSL